MTSTVHKELGIILNRRQYGEADLIVTFLGEEFGRQTGIARSSLLSSRRFGGALEPATIAYIHYKSRKGRMIVIEEADIEVPAISLMQSAEKFNLGMRAIELAMAFLPEGMPTKNRFELLKKFIIYLSKNDPKQTDSISFDLNWLKYSGYAPVFSHCCFCGKDKTENWALIPNEGSVSCDLCAKTKGVKALITDKDREMMNDILNSKPVNFISKNYNVIDRSLNDYITYILGRSLKGRNVLNLINSK